MKISCKYICKLQEIFANLKCPGCFSAKVQLSEDEQDENATCESCGCRFEFKLDRLMDRE